MRNYKKTALVVLGLSAALLGGGAHAGIVVDNGVVTATGTYVTYTFNEADLKLFGPVGGVSLSGDTLVFAPGSFSNSTDGVVESTMQITVAAHSGYQLTSFGLTEGGSYTWGDAGVHLDVSGEFGVQGCTHPGHAFRLQPAFPVGRGEGPVRGCPPVRDRIPVRVLARATQCNRFPGSQIADIFLDFEIPRRGVLEIEALVAARNKRQGCRQDP